jgi:hypothetical protein
VARVAGSRFHRRLWHSPLSHTQAGEEASFHGSAPWLS